MSDVEDRGSEIAYALYVLARNRQASVGDLRYYADTKLEAFSSPMAVAQLAASLALYGDAQRAEATFQAALQLAQNNTGTRLLSLGLWLAAARWRGHAGARRRKQADAIRRARTDQPGRDRTQRDPLDQHAGQCMDAAGRARPALQRCRHGARP